jgi:hypothetical protein
MADEQKKAVIKMSVNLSPDVVETLRALARKRNASMTEVLKDAIGTEQFVDKVSDESGKILVEDKDGRIRQLVFQR